MKQETERAARTKGQSRLRQGGGSNSVEDSGEYGGATLGTPMTHAPDLDEGNSSVSHGIQSNGVTPGSPIGNPDGGEGTFQKQGSTPFNFNVRKVVAEAHANQGSKTFSKTRSESDSGPGGFKGASTAGNRANV